MRYCTLEDIPHEAVVQTYHKNASRGMFSCWLIATLPFLFIFWLEWGRPTIFFISIINIIFFFNSILASIFIAILLRLRLSRNSWAVKTTDSGVYINCHNMDIHYSVDHPPTIFFIPKQDIKGIRQTTSHWLYPRRLRDKKMTFPYIDILLHEAISQDIIDALHAERRRKKSSIIEYNNYLVHFLAHDSGLRLMWNWVRPATSRAVLTLGENYPTLPDETHKHASWKNLSQEEKDASLITLWEHGHLSLARKIMRRNEKRSPEDIDAWFKNREASFATPE